MGNEAFLGYPLTHGAIFVAENPHRYMMSGMRNDRLVLTKPIDSCDVALSHVAHFGYISGGTARLITSNNTYIISEGYSFMCSGAATIEGAEGIVITQHVGEEMPDVVTGKLEHKGRLRYIDRCSDSLIISPRVMGQPCLNLLYFPPDVFQTAHTHPSDRVGMILSGSGRCHTENGIIELEAGMLFRILANGVHNFETTGEEMRVLAYHPDSDFGPTDKVHPMINRTIIDGVSASDLV